MLTYLLSHRKKKKQFIKFKINNFILKTFLALSIYSYNYFLKCRASKSHPPAAHSGDVKPTNASVIGHVTWRDSHQPIGEQRRAGAFGMRAVLIARSCHFRAPTWRRGTNPSNHNGHMMSADRSVDQSHFNMAVAV